MDEKDTLIYRVARFGRAISDSNRVLILKILGSSPDQTYKVGDLAEVLEISQPATTKHLQILYETDLILRKKVGNSVFYGLNESAVSECEKLLNFCFERYGHECKHHFQCKDCPYGDTCI